MREVNSMFVVTQGQKCIYKWRAFQRHPYPLVVVPLDLLFFHGYLATINQSVIFHFKESGVHTFGLWNSWVPRKLCLGRGLSNGVSDKDSFGTPAFPGGNKNDKLICCLLLFKQTQAGWHSAILTLERERERERETSATARTFRETSSNQLPKINKYILICLKVGVNNYLKARGEEYTINVFFY